MWAPGGAKGDMRRGLARQQRALLMCGSRRCVIEWCLLLHQRVVGSLEKQVDLLPGQDTLALDGAILGRPAHHIAGRGNTAEQPLYQRLEPLCLGTCIATSEEVYSQVFPRVK